MCTVGSGLWHDLFAPGIAAAFGTLAGAVVALWADRRDRERRVEDEHVTATNKAICVLVTIWNDLDGYRRKHIERHRNDPDQWYSLQPVHLPAPVAFDTSSLAYLFELEGHTPTLPLEVDIENGRYVSIHEVAEFRCRVHTLEAQPAIERGLRTLAGQLPLAEMIVQVTGGSRVLETLRGLTKDLISGVDDSLVSIPKTIAKLRTVAKSRYPKRQIIRLVPGAPQSQSPNTDEAKS